MRTSRSLPLFLALVLVTSTPVVGAELAGVTMPDTVEIDDRDLVLNGMALRQKFIFDVYVAGLYLPQRESSWKRVLDSDTPRHLVMHWSRSVDEKKICEGWKDSLEANVPDASAKTREELHTLCSWMEDVRTGDRFVFTYLPGEGTTIVVKDERKGTIEGKDFADALFSSWIGPKPGPGEDFRAALMGGVGGN